MKRRSQQVLQRIPTWSDVQVVCDDAPPIRVREYVVEGVRGVRYAAELSTAEPPLERAVVDAGTHDDLKRLVEVAARAFAVAVGLRQRYGR